MRLGFTLLLGVSLLGCHRRDAVHSFDSSCDARVAEWLTRATSEAETAPTSDESTRLRETMRESPAGYAVAVVGMKASREHGAIVILTDPARGRFVPLAVSAADGLAIELRLSKQKFEQPMTHDLLDRAIRELGGRLVRAELDGTDNAGYRARVVVVVGERTISLEARPSDAIALAVGNEVPLFVSSRLFDAVEPGEGDVANAKEQASARAQSL